MENSPSLPLTGPFVQAALFCEKVLEEKDGALTLVRVVDTFTQTAEGTSPPQSMPAFPVQTKLVLSLKSGQALGRHTVRVQPEAPSGLQLPAIEVPVHLERDRGTNLILDMNFAVAEEGTYWFSIFLGEQLLTRMPLRVLYQPLTSSST